MQQWYSPLELSRLAKHVLGNRLAVFDPTAGDGSLLQAFEPSFSFGVEIDTDQIANANGRYTPIQGDIQHVFPLLYQVCPRFPAVIANPPFGLRDWTDETVKDGLPVGSAALTFIYSTRLLQEDGQLVFVCGADQFDREIANLPEAAGVYFVALCNDLFEGSKHPCAVAFAVHPSEPRTGEIERRAVPRSMLDLLAAPIVEARARAFPSRYFASYTPYGTLESYRKAFTATQAEYKRRTTERLASQHQQEFHVELAGGSLLNISLPAFARLALSQNGMLRQVEANHKRPISYYGTYERDWTLLTDLADAGLLTIQPRVTTAVDELLADTRRTLCPLYPVKETMRLGYLADLRLIPCKTADPSRGFIAGSSYTIQTQTHSVTKHVKKMELVKRGKDAGEWRENTYVQERKALQITIFNDANQPQRFYDTKLDEDDESDDIRYLVQHFELPDPGDVGSRFPEETEANRKLLQQIEDDTLYPHSVAYSEKHPDQPPVRLKHFQREDLARLLVKGNGLLAWEQGLGKTIGGGAAYIEACWRRGAQKVALLIVPQDLIPQWRREVERVLGREITLIKTHGEAKRIAGQIRRREIEGIFISYFEALAVNGTGRSEMQPEKIIKQWTEQRPKAGTGCYRDGEFVPLEFETAIRTLSSKDICPQCQADRKSGWNGKNCRAKNEAGRICGYSHFLHRVKPMGSILSTTFANGVVLVDEGTLIQGDYSARSLVVRGMQARCKLLMTGTPIKNYVPQAFWLLWWALGNQSKRFPYGWNDKGDFERNHAVVQWLVSKGNRANRKVLPEVTNLSALWRLLASSIIRRRKEETGEPLVQRTFHPITVPLGVAQRAQIEAWTKRFPAFFAEKYPDSPVVKAGAHVVMAPMLGLGMKLDYAATCPQGDPDWSWTQIEGVSNFTPANLRTLELTLALVKQGRKVVVGSQWLQEVAWLTERLSEKGVRVAHLLDSSGQTASPRARARAVHEFQHGPVQVLVVGIQSIRLGHNLDRASALVVNGLPWDWESFDQFCARVHRLTSKRPVDVYLIVPGVNETTITGRKWKNLRQKGDSASLALDGRLIEQHEKPVSEEDVIRELQENGVPITGDEVPEHELESLWLNIPRINDYDPDLSVLDGDPVHIGKAVPTIQYDEPIGPEPEPVSTLSGEEDVEEAPLLDGAFVPHTASSSRTREAPRGSSSADSVEPDPIQLNLFEEAA